MMEISILGLLFGLILLVIPFYVCYKYNVGFQNKILVSFGKMILYTSITGVFLFFLEKWNNVAINILCVLLMAIIASISTLRKSQLKSSKLLVPVFVGILSSSLIIGLYVILVVLGLKNPFDLRCFIPVLGLLIGTMIDTNAKALTAYYMGLKHHNQLYYYLLGNGASHSEAVAYFIRRALQCSMLPTISQMSKMIISVSPVIMWVMIIGGAKVITAVEFQIVMIIASISVSTISLLVTLYAARYYSFDEYSKLKEI